MRRGPEVFLAVALVLVLAACASKSSPPVARPFAAPSGLESGPSGVGDGPSTPTGDHLRCRNGRHYAQNLTVRNRSGVAVTLIRAATDPRSAQIVRRVAVQFRLAPPPPRGDQIVVGLRNWSGSAARPTTVPSGRSAWVQSNFAIHNCDQLQPGQTLIANRAITLLYRANGHKGTQRIASRSARIVLTAPAVPAAAQSAIKIAVPAAVAYVPVTSPSNWRYVSWDAGRETPDLFSTGRGLNIWFSLTPSSRTAVYGFHVFVQPSCSMKPRMKTFRFGGVAVAWSTTFEDSEAWRCVASTGSEPVEILVSSVGSGYDSKRVVNQRAAAIARMVASAQPIR